MLAKVYLELKKTHEKELNDFPIAYAFNDQQLKEALAKLGVESTKECVTVFGHGDIVKKSDASKLIAMFKRQNEEVHELLRSDKEAAYEAFLYEMNNHEYAINWDGDDAIYDCFAIDYERVRDWGLEDAYRKARAAHYKQMEDWGVF